MTIWCLYWRTDNSAPEKQRYFSSKDKAVAAQKELITAFLTAGVVNFQPYVVEIKVE